MNPMNERSMKVMMLNRIWFVVTVALQRSVQCNFAVSSSDRCFCVFASELMFYYGYVCT